MYNWSTLKKLIWLFAAKLNGGDVTKTVIGSPAHITDALAKDALSVLASIETIQDLHGYANPWPAGGGTNLIPLTVDTIKAANGGANTWNGNSKTISGVTYTILTDEAGNVTGINANGTVPAKGVSKLNLGTIHAVSGTTYGIKKFNADDGGNFFGNIKPRFSSATDANIYGNTTMTADSDKDVAVSYYIMSGAVANNRLITPFIAVTSIAPTVFAPYSNICPISGSTGLSVYVSPTQDQQDATTYAVDWTSEAGTVYGGTVDVVTGVLTINKAYAVLNNPDKWVESATNEYRYEVMFTDRKLTGDSYTGLLCSYVGISPNSGRWLGANNYKFLIKNLSKTLAQVKQDATDGNIAICYELATPLTYQLTPQEVQMLLGENYVWSSTGGNVSVTYLADGNANPLQSLNILLGGNYSNPKTADDVSDKEALEIILGGNK